MTNRSADWFAQAEHDLEMAIAARRGRRHDWACFAAHQAAEKAVKAAHLRFGQDAWGHGIERLLRDLPGTVDPGLLDRAKVLDTFYVPTRYADSHPEGAPFEHYGQLQSKEAIEHARAVIEFARAALAGP
jgi:HEPN domain-containing protein